MITKISLNNVASYKKQTTLETDKKVNLIYGLNGTGKSILSNYLYEKDHNDFSDCAIEGLNAEDILVYSQKFIEDYFFEPDNLKGIFTLSKENKEAEEKIRKVQVEIGKLEKEKQNKATEKTDYETELTRKKQDAENKTWEIKQEFAGGDRVLEYCLDNLKKKGLLFDHLKDAVKSNQQPTKTTNQLKKEVEAIQGDTAQKHEPLPKLNFTGSEVEKNKIFQKNIVGNENSTVAELINKLQNSDWVKDGLQYLPEEIKDSGEHCPFCQNKTITTSLLKDIQSFFNETFENDIKELNNILISYETAISSLPGKETYELNPFIAEKKDEFKNLYNAVIRSLISNKDLISNKIKTPSQKLSLVDSATTISKFNQFIEEINKAISAHNSKIDNKETSLTDIKNQFWQLMRWNYDQTVAAYLKEEKDVENKISNISKKVIDTDKQIKTHNDIIREQQKNTVNIEKAVTAINNGLVDLGLDDFCIKKYSENLYKIVRGGQDSSDTFLTLSEGEKMIISFLYFVELCRGKKSAADVGQRKIIVIDDPISSLTHIFIFNIGQLIKKEFLLSDKYEQVFILTHSLYFFYELTDTNHKRRKEKQQLFRMTKNCDGSQIFGMKYEEIQNDYHSYWQIIKDDKQSPALIANCMRNIIEYFFNFIENKDLNNVFQKPELQDNKFQAFCRFVNRESHSFGHNIFDCKEFDYNNFKEALGLVFQASGYKEHYEEMIK